MLPSAQFNVSTSLPVLRAKILGIFLYFFFSYTSYTSRPLPSPFYPESSLSALCC